MAKLKGEFQTDNGDILYPHTSSDVVFMSDGKNVQDQLVKSFSETIDIGKGKSLIWKQSGSCNDFLFGEWYCTPEVTDLPSKSAYYLICKYGTNDYVYQKAVEQGTGESFERTKWAGKWGDWQVISGDKVYSEKKMPATNNIDDFKSIGYVTLGDTASLKGTFPPYKASFSWGKLIFDGIHQILETQNQTPTGPESVGRTFKRTYYVVQGKWGVWEEIPRINQVMMKRVTVENVDVVNYFKNIGLAPGIYYINQNCTNKPSLNTFYIATFERSPVGADWKLTLRSFSPQNRIFVGDCWNGTFSGWQEVLTTNKTYFEFSPKAGYTFTNQVSYLMADELYISLTVSRADGGTFPVGVYSISTCPIAVKGQTPLVTATDSSGQIVDCGNAYLEGWNLNMRIHVKDASTKFIAICGLARKG